MPYTRFLRADHVLPDLKARTLEDAIVEILQAVTGKAPDINTEVLIDSVLSREKMRSTAVGGGIALPHAQTGEIRRPMILIGRSQQGIPSGASDGEPVKHLFMVLSKGRLTFRLLGRLRAVLEDPSLRESLEQAETAEQMVELLMHRKGLAHELEQVFSDPDHASQIESDKGRKLPPKAVTWLGRLFSAISQDTAFFLGQLRVSSTLWKKLLLLTVTSGVVGGLGAILFNWTMDMSGLSFESLADAMPYPWMVALVPALGGVLCGLIKQHGGLSFDIPCATDGYVECVQHDGAVKPKVPFLLIIAASITIGSGGSCGRECPTAYIGSGLGAIAARFMQFLRLDKLLGVKLGRRDFRLLAICGAAAGLSAIFRAPVGAALFVCEVLYEHGMEAKSILPALLSSCISFLVFSSVYGFEPLYRMDSIWQFGIYNLLFAVFAGVGSAAVGWFYVRFFYKVFHIARASKLPDWIKPGIGGLLHGVLIATIGMQLWGLGYDAMQDAIDGHYGLWFLLILCFGKIIGTAFTVAAGGSGGVLAPSLYVGCMLGGFLGLIFESFFSIGTPIGVYAVIGMAALFSSVGKVPFSLPILLMEATRNFTLIVPIFLGSAIGYGLSGPFKIYESQEPYPGGKVSGGFNALGETEADLLAPYPVSAAMTKELDVIEEGTPVSGILRKFKYSDSMFFPVQGRDGSYKGTIALDQMKSLLLEEHVDKLVVASDVADLSYPVVTADLSLAETLSNFETEGVRFLPVVDEENMLIGLLDRQEVMKLLKKQILDRTAGTEYLGTSRWRKAVESD
ncbi:MAG: chloride channel protein [Deltaproteobacteria bacterium]|nr:chloride channel protein [Deltaproteobacteria bacterium]